MRRHPERAEAVQDRRLEAGCRRHLWVSVQRVIVAGEPIDQRRLRQSRQVAGRIGFAFGQLVDRPPAFGRATETAVAAGKGRRGQGRQFVARRLVDDGSLLQEQGSLVGPLVDDFGHLVGRHHRRFRRQGLVNFEALFAMQDTDPVDPGLRLLDPESGRGQYHRHAGQGRQVFLIGEAQLRLVQGVHVQAEAERIEDRVPLAIALNDFRKRPIHQLVVVDRHRPPPRLRGDPS